MSTISKDDNKPHIDPYLQWAVATKFAYLGGESVKWYPVLVELRKSVAEFWAMVDQPRFRTLVRIAPIFQQPPPGIEQTSFCTILATKGVLEAIVKGSGDQVKELEPMIKALELGSPVVQQIELMALAKAEQTAGAGPPPQRAIVAVIDDGLAFANERFCDKSGKTRFKYFWNQDDPTFNNAPPGFGWGRELRESEINTLLASCTHAGLVDEDDLYRQAGQKLVARRARHGTHVADLACGLNPRDATVVWAEEPYLIGVQLPHWVTEETSGGWLTPVVIYALWYILSRAADIATEDGTAPLPIVVNLSYGKIAGPHDGTGLLEGAIDELIKLRSTPLCVVLPAGNHYLQRCHARFNMAKAQPANEPVQLLQWRVQPDSESAAFMEIWLPHSAAGQPLPSVEVRITTPEGVSSPWIGPGGVWAWPPQPPPAPQDVRFLATYVDLFPPGSRPNILLAMAPTSQVAVEPMTAPAGTWLVEIKNTGRAIAVDAWIQRGDTPFGYPLRGRQSRFDDPEYVFWTKEGRPEQQDVGPSYIKRENTINALGTGKDSIVIGGFRISDLHATDYSGAGCAPAAPPFRNGPDAAGVADDSHALYGVLAAGTRTGSVFAMNGTSAAAPQITRRVAERMALRQPNNRPALQTLATALDPNPPTRPPFARGGGGRIPFVAGRRRVLASVSRRPLLSPKK